MLRWVGLLARLLLGGVWIVAGALKIANPIASVSAVRAYQLLPVDVAEVVGSVLPTLELVIGVCLILGVLVRGAATLSGVLLVAFVIGIVSVWVRGISIDCGCFGDGGADPDAMGKYPWEIARDLGLLALSGFLVWRPRTPYAADNVLLAPARSTPEDADVELNA